MCILADVLVWLYVQRNDEELDIFMERLNLKNENSEFWRKRFTGEDILDGEESLARASSDTDDDTFDDDDDDEEDEDVEVEEEVDDLVEDGGEVEEGEPPEMLAMQLLKNKKDVPEKVVFHSLPGLGLVLRCDKPYTFDLGTLPSEI